VKLLRLSGETRQATEEPSKAWLPASLLC